MRDENQHGDITRRIHLPDDNDNADNSNIHRNINSIGIASQQYDDGRTYSYSVRFQQLINNTKDLHPIFNETHNNATQSTSPTMDYNPNDISSNKEHNDDTIFDDLTRGFTFAALFCLSLYCLHKCCCYTCIKCGCCPDERIVQARMRKLRLMKKRSYHPNATINGDDGRPPLDTRKWAAWMMAHRGNVDTAEDGGYYYSAVVPGGGSNDDDDGIWDANTDDGSTAWDDETGFIDFGDTATSPTDTGGLELACRSSSNSSKSRSAIPELEYGEGEELEDESHDSRLFDVDDGGKGVNREADKFFTGGGRRRGQENGGNNGIGQAGRIKDRAVVVADRNNMTVGESNEHCMTEQSFFEAMQQPLSGRNDAGSILVNGSEGGDAINVSVTMPHDTTPMVDAGNWERENDEDIELMEMDSDNIDADDRGYDEETDLLGLRSDSPPPLDLEEMSRIEKKLIEDMENAKPF
ncbi:hypothetical protein ACHAWU_008547 [Discostella pseudostelligera]|uniref:Uncharacterized protein n=1 Tax=Discostella pseudostelligera TaxID=259834 RepID=A0ABD3M5S4_9STRA